MGQSKRPKKPDRPSVSVVFPKEGSPFSNVERYPRTQHELEFAMCQKFVGAMGQSYERRLFNLQRGEEPSDLICETLDGEQVGIQVAEAIDPRLREGV